MKDLDRRIDNCLSVVHNSSLSIEEKAESLALLELFLELKDLRVLKKGIKDLIEREDNNYAKL